MENKLCVTIAVKKGKEFLLLRRAKHDTNPGLWEFPGGGIESYDLSAEKAAIRELLEETGLAASNITKLKFNERIDDKKTKKIIVFHFLTEVSEPHIVLSDDHDSFKWVEKKDILSMTPSSEVGTDSYMLLKGLS